MSESSKRYIRTDLAVENRTDLDYTAADGIQYSEEQNGNITTTALTVINEDGALSMGKPIGTYITISFPKLWLSGDNDTADTVKAVSAALRNLISESVNDIKSVLVAGLGNQYITTDAIGPQAVKNILVTRHIKASDPKLFQTLSRYDISAIVPGVVGQTGIETFELIAGAVRTVKPDLIIVIDALAARSSDRLAATIQLTDNGISPGSGIGNNRRVLNRESLGIPVIALGVPTVVNSSTLVYDALDKAGITEISEPLKEILENGRNFFVSLKESDIAVESLSNVISEAINKAFMLDE